MRTLIEPPPSMRCDNCHGELRFKQLVEAADGTSDLNEEIFICVRCGCEKVFIVHHDHNMPHIKGP